MEDILNPLPYHRIKYLSSKLEPSNDEIKPFTKDDYQRTVQEKTAEFVYKHFGSEVKKAFRELRENAIKRRHCHHEIKFEVPDPYDVYKAEETLRCYFRGLGFEVIAEPRKDDTNIIILTLT